MTRNLLAPTLLLVLVALGLSACGGSGKTQTVIIQQTTTVQSAPKPATVTAAPPTTVTVTQTEETTTTEESGSVVPDLIGERLDVAESDLDDLGITYEEVGGGMFGIIVKSNWTVCDQEPKAGKSADSVKLIVDREC